LAIIIFSILVAIDILLSQLKSQGLSHNALHIIFIAIVLSIVTDARPPISGQLSKASKARIDSRAYVPEGL